MSLSQGAIRDLASSFPSRGTASEVTAILDFKPPPASPGVGATNGAAVSVREHMAKVHRTVMPITNLSVTMTDATTAGSHGAHKLYDFPAGNILILGATTNLTIARVGTQITAAAAVVGALGSVATATDNATLTGTEANVVPSTTATLTSGAGSMLGSSSGSVTLNGTSTPIDLFLNFAIPDAGSGGNDALLVNGTVEVAWINLGDN
jgi:hypothetical protein